MGSQEPSVRVSPEYNYTDGESATKILSVAGLYPDKWQENLLGDWMGRGKDDIWTSPTCGLSVPRQNGKTLIVIGRAVTGMIINSEWVIYTAHLQKTATETFLEIKDIFEGKALEKYVKEIKSALGREQIILKNGGRIMFVARTRNGGRGLHGDLEIFDEAQELTSEQQASFLPALAASGNPQTIYIGTPPDPNCVGTVFRKIRQKVLDNQSENTSWTEFSVDKIGDVTDRSRWAATNPAMGYRIRESTVASECEQMDADTFARERLGYWSPIVERHEDKALDADKWKLCESELMKPEGKTAYGVRIDPDGTVSLAGAVVPKEGKPRISLIKEESITKGVKWVSDWLSPRYDSACCVVLDGRNGVDLICDRISETWKYKGSVIVAKTNDVIAAASLLSESVKEGNLTWYKFQEELDNSAITSIKRPISGGWGFGGENSSPITACSLALYGAKTSKRDPSRKGRIG